MRHLVHEAGLSDRIVVDSAGTGAWHAGEAPDRRSIATADAHGVSLAGQRARQVTDADYFDAHLVLAMDQSNLETLTRRAPSSGVKARLELLMSSPRGEGDDVPDPYYGGDQGFEQVYQMVLRACSVLLEELKGELEA